MTETTGQGPSTEAQSEQKPNPSSGCVCGGTGPALFQKLHKMMPSAAAGQHFRNARIEMLKGFREMLDRRIESLSGQHAKGTKVNVE